MMRTSWLSIHNQKGFENCAIRGTVGPLPFPAFDRHRTYQELDEQLRHNSQELRTQLLFKIRRDVTILSIISAKFSAENYHECRNWFTLQAESLGIDGLGQSTVPNLSFYNEYKDSCDALLRANVSDPNYQPRTYSDWYHRELSDFHQCFRPPALPDDDDVGGISSSLTARGRSVKRNVPMQGSRFVQRHRGPVCLREVLIETPAMKITRDLKKIVNPNMADPVDTNAAFGSAELCSHIQGGPLEVAGSVAKYIYQACGHSLAIGPQPVDLQTLPISVDQTIRHQMKRNMAAFVAQICGHDTATHVPLAIDGAPQVCQTCVSAVLTVFTALKGCKLAHYCDVVPFSEKCRLDGPRMLMVRSKMFSRITEKCPKLSREARSGARVSKSATSNAEFGEEFDVGDALVASLILPMAIRMDSVLDFLRDEIKIESEGQWQGQELDAARQATNE
jgi:hypothetical protein